MAKGFEANEAGLLNLSAVSSVSISNDMLNMLSMKNITLGANTVYIRCYTYFSCVNITVPGFEGYKQQQPVYLLFYRSSSQASQRPSTTCFLFMYDFLLCVVQRLQPG